MKSNILVWNCQGAANPRFHRVIKEYLRDFDPKMVILVETKVSGIQAGSVNKRIRLTNSHRVEAKGFSGGIWMLWKSYVEVAVM